MASRTRDEMTQMIDRGESVFVREGGGLRIVTRREDLPSDADIAKASGTEEEKAAARKALQERAHALLAEADALDAPAPAEPEKPRLEAPAPEPRPEVAPIPEPKPRGK